MSDCFISKLYILMLLLVKLNEQTDFIWVVCHSERHIGSMLV